MSSNRNWFSTYRSIEGEVVLIGNNSQSKAIGIGTVELRMHDETKVTLIVVRHVPDNESYLPWHSRSKRVQVLC